MPFGNPALVGFTRVPTHAVGVHPEHREYPRATLKPPPANPQYQQHSEEFPSRLLRAISVPQACTSSVQALPVGASIEIDVVLVSKPMGHGSVVLATRAHVQRHEPASMPGWYGIAALFDDVQFDRDDRVPSRFLKS